MKNQLFKFTVTSIQKDNKWMSVLVEELDGFPGSEETIFLNTLGSYIYTYPYYIDNKPIFLIPIPSQIKRKATHWITSTYWPDISKSLLKKVFYFTVRVSENNEQYLAFNAKVDKYLSNNGK